MGLFSAFRRFIGCDQPTVVDFEAYEQQPAATGTDGPHVVGRVGPGMSPEGTGPVGLYRTQQSYDSLLQTVRELREQLDGQAKRQDELLARLATLPQAAEVLPQTSKMQSDLLQMINDRLSAHAQQQRVVTELASKTAQTASKDVAETLQALREQIEMANEIDRQLIDSFNRFSLMIDRLQLANHHAVECLQQVRDSYATTALQMQDWIEKSRQRSNWLIAAAFVMSAGSLIAVIVLLSVLASGSAPH